MLEDVGHRQELRLDRYLLGTDFEVETFNNSNEVPFV